MCISPTMSFKRPYDTRTSEEHERLQQTRLQMAADFGPHTGACILVKYTYDTPEHGYQTERVLVPTEELDECKGFLFYDTIEWTEPDENEWESRVDLTRAEIEKAITLDREVSLANVLSKARVPEKYAFAIIAYMTGMTSKGVVCLTPGTPAPGHVVAMISFDIWFA